MTTFWVGLLLGIIFGETRRQIRIRRRRSMYQVNGRKR